MFCKKCGAQLDADALFCAQCGTNNGGAPVAQPEPVSAWPVAQPAPAPGWPAPAPGWPVPMTGTPAPAKKRNGKLIVVAVVVLVLAAVGLVLGLTLGGGGGGRAGAGSIEAALNTWCQSLGNGNVEAYLSLYPKELTGQMSAVQRAEFADSLGRISRDIADEFGKPVQITYTIEDSESDWDMLYELADDFNLRDLRGKVSECREVETKVTFRGPEDWDYEWFDFCFIQMNGRWYLLNDEFELYYYYID